MTAYKMRLDTGALLTTLWCEFDVASDKMAIEYASRTMVTLFKRGLTFVAYGELFALGKEERMICRIGLKPIEVNSLMFPKGSSVDLINEIVGADIV